MDDPLFDPWSLDEETAPADARTKPRWRSRDTPSPVVPEPRPVAPTPDPAPSPRMPRSRLPGTPGFLRTMAAPRLRETALRLSMARHEARVDDLLDGPAPTLRLVLQPWSSPLADERPREGVLEIGIEDPDPQHVVVRYGISCSEPPVVREDRIPTTKLSSSWLDARLLDFVTLVLDEA
jgi:hypothetical protein